MQGFVLEPLNGSTPEIPGNYSAQNLLSNLATATFLKTTVHGQKDALAKLLKFHQPGLYFEENFPVDCYIFLLKVSSDAWSL